MSALLRHYEIVSLTTSQRLVALRCAEYNGGVSWALCSWI